jgi:hypothetical protein
MNDVIDPSRDLPPILSKFLREDAPPLSREDADGIHAAAVRFYARERWRDACELFRLLVLSRPDQARGWIGLAACHEVMGDDERALVLYQLACLAPAPNRHRKRARLYLARFYMKVGRHDDARVELDTLAMDPIEGDAALDVAAAELRRCLMDTIPEIAAIDAIDKTNPPEYLA